MLLLSTNYLQEQKKKKKTWKIFYQSLKLKVFQFDKVFQWVKFFINSCCLLIIGILFCCIQCTWLAIESLFLIKMLLYNKSKVVQSGLYCTRNANSFNIILNTIAQLYFYDNFTLQYSKVIKKKKVNFKTNAKW